MRIVGGEWRGRRLVAAAGRATRPTPDRVREAVFDVLAAMIARGDLPAWEAHNVCDLFAGSGALGLEALSRGAPRCTFVESGPEARRALRANIAALVDDDERARVVARDARRALRADAAAGTTYTLVFVDAPYVDYEALERDLERDILAVLAAGAVLVVETARERIPRLPLREVSTKVYGGTRTTFLER
jgi:16S rRNA (guanine966-N2)-methyltransferase